MGKSRKQDNTFEIKEIISVVSERDTSDWCKAVTRISWNGKPPTLDLRHLNMSNLDIFPKGISFTDEEADRLVDILLDNDYGNIDHIAGALEKRRSRFTTKGNDSLVAIEKKRITVRFE